MKAFVADVLFWTGVGIAVLKLLDLLFPKSFETKLTGWLTLAWAWLSYQRTLPYIRYLRTYNRFRWFLIPGTGLILVLLAVLLADWMRVENSGPFATAYLGTVAFTIVPMLAIFLLRHQLFRMFRWATKTQYPVAIVLRFLLAAFAIFLLFSAAVPFANNFVPANGTDPTVMQFTLFCLIYIFVVICVILYVACAFITAYFVLILLLTVVALLARELFRVLVEYDKGPILGAAALLGLIGGLAKVFA